MMERKITLAIDSNLENVPLVAATINKLCSFIRLSDLASYQIEVCVVEAVNNAIKHAYRNEGGHEVEVVITLHQNKLIVDICDQGRTMKQESKTFLDFDPSDLKNLPEGGMGLFIINSIMDELNYRTCRGKNTLTMTKFVSVET